MSFFIENQNIIKTQPPPPPRTHTHTHTFAAHTPDKEPHFLISKRAPTKRRKGISGVSRNDTNCS